MEEQKGKRLAQVAKEFNVSPETIFEFLDELGEKVEQSPDTRLGENLVGLVAERLKARTQRDDGDAFSKSEHKKIKSPSGDADINDKKNKERLSSYDAFKSGGGGSFRIARHIVERLFHDFEKDELSLYVRFNETTRELTLSSETFAGGIRKYIRPSKSYPNFFTLGQAGLARLDNKVGFPVELTILTPDMENRKFWLYAPGENAHKWEEFYSDGIMALGWGELGDLRQYGDKEEIAEAVRKHYGGTGSKMNSALANYEFVHSMKVGDVIIAKQGKRSYIGYGVVTSDYYYSDIPDFGSQRKVDWIEKGNWTETEHDIVAKTLTDISKFPDYVSRLTELMGIDAEDNQVSTLPKNERVSLSTDEAVDALADALNRAPFAEAIFKYVQLLWKKSAQNDAYTILLNGKWGSGKSSILNMLKELLVYGSFGKSKAEKRSKNGDWLVVDYNAWQNQHIQVPWWVFMDTIFRQTTASLSWRTRWWANLRERLWRLSVSTHMFWYLIGALVLFAVSRFGIVDILDAFDIPTVDEEGNLLRNTEIIKGISTTLGTISGIALLFKAAFSSLLPGSEKAAQHFKENARDPMKLVKQHYQKVVGYTGKRVAVFIDDIDRCHPKVVVELLEGIQTLFKSEKVLYVIAGDAQWVKKSFEIEYQDFNELHQGLDGQTMLGHVFVQKTLQQVINLPQITEEEKKAYWEFVLTGRKPSDLSANPDLEKKAKQANTEQEKADVLRGASEDEKPKVRQILALNKLSEDSLKDIEHELLKFYDLLEPNPRSMKRLVNDIALERTSHELSGLSNQIDKESHMCWAIFRNRFPIEAHEILVDFNKMNSHRKGKDEDMKKILDRIKDDDLKRLISLT